MFLNFLLAFVIPWLLGAVLVIKQPRIVLRIAPFGATIGFLFNEIGVHFNFWRVTPLSTFDASFSTLPYNLGVYPVLASFMIYLIQYQRWNAAFGIVAFSAITTVAEWCAVMFGKVTYSSGWNIIWTFVSYAIAFSIGYLYEIVWSKTKKNQ